LIRKNKLVRGFVFKRELTVPVAPPEKLPVKEETSRTFKSERPTVNPSTNPIAPIENALCSENPSGTVELLVAEAMICALPKLPYAAVDPKTPSPVATAPTATALGLTS
jgi:hypothetical protein